MLPAPSVAVRSIFTDSFLTRKRLRLYFGGLLLLQLSLFVRAVPFALDGSMDYRTFYTAGHMTQAGSGKTLYDYASEARTQNAIVSPSENALPFMSPAYTALLFVPLSWAHYRTSYFIFFTLNIALAAFALFTLRSHLRPLFGVWPLLPALLFFTFLPVGVCLIQGQLSLILLLVVCSSFLALQRDRPFLAGLLLSLGLIKFQVILPVALLFLLWRRLRFVSGFALGAAFLALLSVLVTGAQVQAQYLHSLVFTSSNLSAAASQVRYGIYPSRMPNIFGLMHAILPTAQAALALTAIASAALFVWAAFQRASLPLALLVGLAVSYHLYLHDLSLLLLPLCLVLSQRASGILAYPQSGQVRKTGWRDRTALAASIFLLLAPLERLLIAADLIYLLVLPVVLLAISLGTAGEAPPTPRRGPATQVTAETTSRIGACTTG